MIIENSSLPSTQKPKNLEVTFDHLLTFTEHFTTVIYEFQARKRLLKNSGTSWGCSKETKHYIQGNWA